MSFPNSYDDDTTLPFVNDNITEIGGEAINALRDAVFAIEQNIGLEAQGSMLTISSRLDVSIYPDGQIKPSAITSLGLVTLPIVDSQIADWAAIPERKLELDHRTQDLFNYITDLSGDVNVALGWISGTGITLAPHIAGSMWNHYLDHIKVDNDTSKLLKNNLRLLRDNTNAFTVLNDINNELITHQWADGSPLPTVNYITTNDGSIFSTDYAHTAGGIFLNTSRFSTIPQTAQDVQAFAEFVDNTSIFLLGTRLQNLYSNGISRESRSSSLLTDGYGSNVVPSTPAIAFLKNVGNSSAPFDDINTGDDIVELMPASAVIANNTFDEKFALVQAGDIIRVNYGTVEIAFIIKEKKYIQNGGDKKYIVRIAGKNIQYAPNASARIDKPLVNINKYGVLALSAANSNVPTIPSSLITVNPRGAQALGLGFNADQLDATHYALYLALYPTGNPLDGYLILPPIDVTGNQGAKPGSYTLDNIIENTNNAFRSVGFNYRFVAFKYEGEFGIALADSYGNTGFSILNAVVAGDGSLDEVGTNVAFPNNVVGMFAAVGITSNDPLGFGPNGSNLASPSFQLAYDSPEAALLPTKLFLPLKRNNYYVNGTEREKINLEINQVLDQYGDGYWPAVITAQSIIPGTPGRVQTTYRVQLDLSASNLKKGKTIVVQQLDGYGTFPNDFGRFIISELALGCCSPTDYTDITVYDSIHGLAVTGASGLALGVGGEVAIYFSADSIAFNAESATDIDSVSPFKRYFEVFIDENGNTFSHERGRFNAGNISPLTVNDVPLVNDSELIKINIVKISPKLKGYQFGSVTKITLNLTGFSSTNGFLDGYLSSWDGTNPISNAGPRTIGRKGEVVRFYDESYIDYIDFTFDVNQSVSDISNKKLDIQLFPTLALDNQIMLIGAFQFNDVSNIVNYVADERQFGNISEKDLTTSMFNYISAPERLLHGNGVLRGFELETRVAGSNPVNGQIYLTGGEVLVNGKFIQLNNDTVSIPTCKEVTSGFPTSNINWLVCINSIGEYQLLVLLDEDYVLDTPGSSRVVSVVNLVNGQTYSVDSSTFNNLINSRKELTPLYIASATTVPAEPPTISLVMHDVRKFVNDGDTILPLKLTTSQFQNAQGNFKSFASILNWVKYNSEFNETVIVKGANSENATINTEAILSNVNIDGQNEAVLTFTEKVYLSSNLTIKNLTMDCEAGLFTSEDTLEQNIFIENCIINITLPAGSPVNASSQVLFDIQSGNKIKFKDCNINVDWAETLLVPTDGYDINQYPTVFRLTNTNNFIVDNCSMTITYQEADPGVVSPGGFFVLVNSDNVTIDNSDFTGNINRFLAFSQSDNLQILNSDITSTFNPTQDLTFNASNLVNTGQGFIYGNITNTVSNIVIDNTTFNYSPAGTPSVTANLADRYSFINLELSTLTSKLNDLRIVNCKFNHLNAGGLVDDIRPAVSIINTYSAFGIPVVSSSQQPILLNAVIANNTCNRNQSIIVTSRLDSNNKMNYPGLAAQNCVIYNNVCGTIGYWIAPALRTINTTPNFNALTDKSTSLLIDNNLCHYISNLDHTGKYFLVSKLVSGTSTNMSFYSSAYVSIVRNNANWIHTGVAYEENSSLSILNNNLSSYDESYMTSFNDSSSNCYGSISYGYAIFVSSNKYKTTPIESPREGNNSSVNISGNTSNTGYWYQLSGMATNYRYSKGYIFSQSSCIISDNILKGTATGSLSSIHLILFGGLNNTIKGNQIYRSSQPIASYIKFDSFDTPVWDNSGSEGFDANALIVDNFFDDPHINDTLAGNDWFDGVSYQFSNVNLSSVVYPRFIVERNKNQTGFAYIPISNGKLQYSMLGGTAFGPDGYDDLNMRLAVGEDSPPFNGTYRSQVLRFRDNETASSRIWGIQQNIEAFVPNNVRLLSLSSAIRSFGSQVIFDLSPPTNAATSNFWMNLTSYVPLNGGLAAFSTISDFDNAIFELNDPVYSLVSGGDFNATSASIPFSIDLTNYSGDDISYRYVTGKGVSITLAVDLRWLRDSAAVDFLVDVVLIKYRW